MDIAENLKAFLVLMWEPPSTAGGDAEEEVHSSKEDIKDIWTSNS